MSDPVEHPSDGEEPGGEERGWPSRSQAGNRGDPDSEPHQVEGDEKGKRHGGQAEQAPQTLVETSCRFFREMNALNRYGKCEHTGSGPSLLHLFWRRPTIQNQEQSRKGRQT
jgi:hypothetical protein